MMRTVLPPLGPVRDVPRAAEILEGRQLLSTGAGAVASAMPAWGRLGVARHWSGGSHPAAEVSHFGKQGGHSFNGTVQAELAHSHRVG
jgi:hypothetical protein